MVCGVSGGVWGRVQRLYFTLLRLEHGARAALSVLRRCVSLYGGDK